tara:strand:+ start:5060 stop:5746 length:687 start_codon:yes stop_codon:yes gene_type:complete
MSDSCPQEVASLLKENMPTISKKMRQAVFDKSHGHCWYCGDTLNAKWHCDHIEPIRRGEGGGVSSKDFNTLHNIDNLAPTCAPCNLFKSVYSLEGFRRKIAHQVERARKSSVNFRVAERFGLIEPTGNEVVFWFERNNQMSDIEAENARQSNFYQQRENEPWDDDEESPCGDLMIAWQPIETAPEDRRVLLFVNNEIRIGIWFDEDLDDIAQKFQPTHWMPLPKPPKP